MDMMQFGNGTGNGNCCMGMGQNGNQKATNSSHRPPHCVALSRGQLTKRQTVQCYDPGRHILRQKLVLCGVQFVHVAETVICELSDKILTLPLDSAIPIS